MRTIIIASFKCIEVVVGIIIILNSTNPNTPLAAPPKLLPNSPLAAPPKLPPNSPFAATPKLLPNSPLAATPKLSPNKFNYYHKNLGVDLNKILLKISE